MEIIVEIVQRNQYKPPCACAQYSKMSGTTPCCNDLRSPYCFRCPGGPCKWQDKHPRTREEMLAKQAAEDANNA